MNEGSSGDSVSLTLKGVNEILYAMYLSQDPMLTETAVSMLIIIVMN